MREFREELEGDAFSATMEFGETANVGAVLAAYAIEMNVADFLVAQPFVPRRVRFLESIDEAFGGFDPCGARYGRDVLKRANQLLDFVEGQVRVFLEVVLIKQVRSHIEVAALDLAYVDPICQTTSLADLSMPTIPVVHTACCKVKAKPLPGLLLS